MVSKKIRRNKYSSSNEEWVIAMDAHKTCGGTIMSHRIMLIPVSTGVGLTSVSVGLVRALEKKSVKVNFFKPISQPRGKKAAQNYLLKL